MNYSLGAGKPLINREQSYVLDRKLLTVHSEDRDISKWANANEFEIVLPQQLLNVQSMRLVEIEVPMNFPVFSETNQNTILFINYNNTGSKALTIKAGTYNAAELAEEINLQIYYSGIDMTGDFILSFDVDNNKYRFESFDGVDFILEFEKRPNYCTPHNNSIFENTFYWGLPYHLGFSKISYSGIDIYADTAPILTSHDTCMYMEIEKYNSYDELYPYNKSEFDHNDPTKLKLVNGNNSYTGKINSAFAKIPLITSNANNVVFESRNIGLQNITHYEPPIERIGRLKFKLRFHNGRLVDFGNSQYNFTLEFNMLRNEIEKKYNVRIPSTYTL